MSEGSNAPKERINITYKAKTNGQNADVELPLKLMIMSDLTASENKKNLEEREILSINKNNFDQVMQKLNINTSFSVKNTLSENNEGELNINLHISNMKDFSPDNIIKQVPELNKLLQLREALMALKGPMGNIPDFRKALLEALMDKGSKEQLLLEIKEEKE
ncbi:type VI secretion system contractile sheath small subunit [Campylobacter novaezeelandiae]|uniref:Type VI secretion system contractile sheath small subunit n=1 Tax=Campylobacter novaezeelandiae TaxID=2267891 RepID=A0A4Q9JUM6_9BACT|nr:type VI secretion system contractile sheath small subunit [Campylobacter novaezeelandiae]MBK1964706.1 type VI secretion system contractile sheath small subunit [Campylobacter novaezeelandiae]MBK1993019.1 type VI secretion system contractile sheath small subunit [Campylobacter novaezeelandiae]QWU80756.1 type VI secretion system, tubular sheath protein [Campylobacter novaezeelandiae]QWU80759.1 type VI secretion system, tubular sheath protein [Campylobacter novaezeelandiae]TBR78606.1 type VI s